MSWSESHSRVCMFVAFLGVCGLSGVCESISRRMERDVAVVVVVVGVVERVCGHTCTELPG